MRQLNFRSFFFAHIQHCKNNVYLMTWLSSFWNHSLSGLIQFSNTHIRHLKLLRLLTFDESWKSIFTGCLWWPYSHSWDAASLIFMNFDSWRILWFFLKFKYIFMLFQTIKYLHFYWFDLSFSWHVIVYILYNFWSEIQNPLLHLIFFPCEFKILK